MHTMKQTISLKPPRHWQEMDFPRWQRHTLGRRIEWSKQYKNRPLCQVVMSSSQTGWACANIGHLSMYGAWWERVILSLNWFKSFNWFCGLLHFLKSQKNFLQHFIKNNNLSIVLMTWVNKEPSLSGILIYTSVSTHADHNGSEWRCDWIF